MVDFDVEERVDYTRYSNRQLVAVPLVVLAVALLIIAGWSLFVNGSPTDPGWPANPGIEFTGGTEIEIQTTDSPAEIRATFEQEVRSVRLIPAADRSQGNGNTYVVEFQSEETDAIRQQANQAGYVAEGEDLPIQTTSASFSAGTQREALFGVLIAFVGMSIVVFLMFRTFVPSIAVVASAFSDIVIPIALMNVLGIELSLGTIAALLMLIGYSVDSDILLNNHILRRSGGFYESAYRAMRTGVTMTLTSIAAAAVMAIVSYIFGVDLLPQIGVVLVFGLSADLMNTYMLNMSLLRWYRRVEV